jgi:membrane-associated phospholipid phosphatase
MHKLFALDAQLSKRIHLPSPASPLWKPAVILAHSGDSWLWAIGVGLVWLFSSQFWHGFAATLEISIVIQALFVFALKQIIRRRRPTGDWGGIYRQFDPHSFPSGHATRAILLCVMAAAMGPGWFGLLVGVWAPLVCLSRVMTGVHYLSDIFGGMLLGFAMGVLMVNISPFWIRLLPFLY